jgi:hypothetical protein
MDNMMGQVIPSVGDDFPNSTCLSYSLQPLSIRGDLSRYAFDILLKWAAFVIFQFSLFLLFRPMSLLHPRAISVLVRTWRMPYLIDDIPWLRNNQWLETAVMNDWPPIAPEHPSPQTQLTCLGPFGTIRTTALWTTIITIPSNSNSSYNSIRILVAVLHHLHPHPPFTLLLTSPRLLLLALPLLPYPLL